MARDETETGERMLLNLGHTFGHALEAWAGFSDKLCTRSRGDRHHPGVSAFAGARLHRRRERGHGSRNHLASAGLPTHIADIAGNEWPQAEALLRLMAQDKKVRAGQLTLILARAVSARPSPRATLRRQRCAISWRAPSAGPTLGRPCRPSVSKCARRGLREEQLQLC